RELPQDIVGGAPGDGQVLFATESIGCGAAPCRPVFCEARLDECGQNEAQVREAPQHIQQNTIHSHSDRSAPSKGDRKAARVAIKDAAMPVINTAASSTLVEATGSRPPRWSTVGTTASIAATAPVASPSNRSNRFSESTRIARWRGR